SHTNKGAPINRDAAARQPSARLEMKAEWLQPSVWSSVPLSQGKKQRHLDRTALLRLSSFSVEDGEGGMRPCPLPLDRRHRLAKPLQHHATLRRIPEQLHARIAPLLRLVERADQHRRRLPVLVARFDDLITLLIQ